MKKNIVIVVIVLVILGLGGYIVYDMLTDNKENDISTNDKQKNDQTSMDIDQKDAKWFNEYLSPFLSCRGLAVSRNTSEFTNDDIYYFVSNYYMTKGLEEKIEDTNGFYTYKILKIEVDDLVYKYFNITDYDIEKEEQGLSIKIVNDDYELTWGGSGCAYVHYENPSVTYDGVNVKVTYDLYTYQPPEEENKLEGKAIFHLKYNNGNYNIVKIEEPEFQAGS